MKHIFLFLFCAIGVAASAHHAQAAEIDTRPATPPAEKEEEPVIDRYGLEIVGADALALGLGLGTKSGTVFGLSYVVGGPIVHAAHDNVGRAAGSFALRTGLPIVGFAVGFSLVDKTDCGDQTGNEKSFCELDNLFQGTLRGGLTGGLIGMASASLIDAALLARSADAPGEAPSLVGVDSLRATPTIALAPSGDFQLGLAGSF